MAPDLLPVSSSVASHPNDPDHPAEVVTSAPPDLLCCVGYADVPASERPWTHIDRAIVPTATTPQSDDGPSSPSRLDPVETSTGRVRNPAVPPLDDTAESSQLTFRHGFWWERRHRIRDGLTACGASEEVMKRFNACGDNAWVMVAKDGSGRLRVAADRCHNRWCEACQTERRRLICRNLLEGLKDHAAESLRFITLTLKSNDEPLSKQLDRIYASWRKLRDVPAIKKCVRGTIAFFEVTISEKDARWHPHIHVLVDGTYLAKEVLSQEWLKITGDSYIVDIKLVRNAAVAAGYIAKYAAKAVSHSVWRQHDKLCEAIAAFTSRRLFNTTGSFRRMDLSKRPADDIGWEPIEPLYKLIARARAGNADAIHILRQLGAANAPDPIDAYLPPEPRAPVSNLSITSEK